MSSTNINEFMPIELVKALSNPIFPSLDILLRSGRHIGSHELDNHSFLNQYEAELSQFYLRYQAELIRAPEGFFYLRPKSTSALKRSILSEIDMLVGKVLCFLYLSPERLANEGIFTTEELFDELLTLADEPKLLKVINQRAQGSDVDKDKLFDKVKQSLRKLRRMGMIVNITDSQKFYISESVFRFGADVRAGDDVKAAQLKLIRDGEAIVHSELPETQGSLLLDDVKTNVDMDVDKNADSESGQNKNGDDKNYNQAFEGEI